MRDRSARHLSRRAWIAGASSVVAAGLVKTKADALSLVAQESPVSAPDPTKVPGRFTSEVGRRATGEQPRRLARTQALSSSSQSPLQDLMGIVTPADLHFERHHGGIPEIVKANHELLVHGMVERPMVFTMSDIERFPRLSRLYFIECSGNGGAAYSRDGMPNEITVQALVGLLSTSEWTGVPLAT